MVPELSSNWKKLQAKIKAESSTSKSTKRKNATTDISHFHTRAARKQKVEEPKTRRQDPTSKSKTMGVTQSSVVSKGTSSTVSPSLALWADENDISPEAIAEAYGLGVKHNALLSVEAPRLNEGLAPGVVVGKYLALDCEMVGIGPDGRGSALARVSVVDFNGRQIYDALVQPREPVTDWRTKVTGLSPEHMVTARDFSEVQGQVAELLKDRILVIHDKRHDLEALELTHPASQIHDTATFRGFTHLRNGSRASLKTLALKLLGKDIQSGHHSSLEDARVTMLIFRKKKPEFDMEHARKYGPRGQGKTGPTGQQKGTKQDNEKKNNKNKKKK